MPALIALGPLFIVVGIVMMRSSRAQLHLRRRMLETPTTPIAKAPASGVVELQGRIVASEAGTVHAPFAARDVVWYRITVEEYFSGVRNSRWVQRFREVRERPFLVDDGSGQLALVHPERASVILDKQGVLASGKLDAPSPELEAFLASRGESSAKLFHHRRTIRYREESLAVGDPIYALGPSRREAGRPTDAGYRAGTSDQLALPAGPELLLTNQPEAKLARALLNDFLLGVAIAVIALGAFVVGVARF